MGDGLALAQDLGQVLRAQDVAERRGGQQPGRVTKRRDNNYE